MRTILPMRSWVRAPVAVVVAASAVTWASGALAATRTTASVYEAFTSQGVIVPRVEVKSGSCWENSIVLERDDAWRCFIGNDIYDPCFSSQRASGVVVCVQAPWSGTGIEIRLTKPLPKPFREPAPSTSLEPWGIQIASGQDCIISSGMGPAAIHGRNLNYYCSPHFKIGLWGFPDRTTQPWTIFIAPLNTTALSQRVAIRHAWM